MALTEREEIGKIEIVGPYKHIQVRTDTIIERDGEEISRSYHRHVIAPGDDLSNEDADVRALALTVHRQDIVEAYQAHIQAQEEQMNDNEG